MRWRETAVVRGRRGNEGRVEGEQKELVCRDETEIKFENTDKK